VTQDSGLGPFSVPISTYVLACDLLSMPADAATTYHAGCSSCLVCSDQ
jgi:hypothetical protein